MKHHESLSPSSFPAIMQCACFESSSGSDQYADAGTSGHSYIEALLKGEEPLETDLLTDEDKEDCEFMAQEIKDFCARELPDLTIQTERKIEIFDSELNLLTFGRKDITCGYITGDVKMDFGWSNDWEKYIPQVDVYALADMRDQGFDQALCFIACIKSRKLFQFWRTRAQAEATFACVFQRRNDPQKKPQACFFCQYCKHLMVCPEINQRIKLVDVLFSKLPDVESLKDPSSTTDPAEWSKILAFGEVTLKQYIGRLQKLRKSIYEAGICFTEENTVPGFKRYTKSGSKQIKDIVSAHALIGLSDEDFYKTVSLSLPKLSDVYAKANGIKKKDSRKEVEGILNELIEISDPKPALEIDPESV